MMYCLKMNINAPRYVRRAYFPLKVCFSPLPPVFSAWCVCENWILIIGAFTHTARVAETRLPGKQELKESDTKDVLSHEATERCASRVANGAVDMVCWVLIVTGKVTFWGFSINATTSWSLLRLRPLRRKLFLPIRHWSGHMHQNAMRNPLFWLAGKSFNQNFWLVTMTTTTTKLARTSVIPVQDKTITNLFLV